jgi:hypothetical protein
MSEPEPIHRRKARIVRALMELRRIPGWRPSKATDPMITWPLADFGCAVKIYMKPIPWPCGARTRSGDPCKALALGNGRCRNHGGLSTGPRTIEGMARTRAGYRAWRLSQKGEGP